ncbi:hypothetical protein Tco_1575912, partial [Tanacetum coccineum]
GYALESAARILNMVPTKKVDKTTYFIWHMKVPNFSYLKVWDCKPLVKRDILNKHESKSIKCIFIGCPKETIDFDKIQRQDAQPSKNTSEHHPKVEHENVKPQSDVNPIHRSARIPQAAERYGFYVDVEAMNAEMQFIKDK